MKKLLLTLIVVLSLGITASAEGNYLVGQRPNNTIGVMRFTDENGIEHIAVRIMDDEHWDEETQSFLRVAAEEGKTPFVDESGRTQIPIREISEAMGFKVDWEEIERRITLTKDTTEIVMHIGNPELIVNGSATQMDTAPRIVNDLTYIPLRYVGEAFGYEVDYMEAELVESR